MDIKTGRKRTLLRLLMRMGGGGMLRLRLRLRLGLVSQQMVWLGLSVLGG